MDILFKQQLIRNQTLSSEEVGNFLFEGVNASSEEITVKTRKKKWKRTFERGMDIPCEGNHIVDKGRHYLYRHIRLDKNEPFYIGVGTKSNKLTDSHTYKSIYDRAYSKETRNDIWHNIVKKNDLNFKVEILIESNNYNFILRKEKEFISMYGKKKFGGLLANLTDGGEGTKGYPSDKYVCAKKVYVYNKEGGYICSYNSTQDAAKALNINRGIISKVATGTDRHHKQIRYLYEYKDLIEPLDLTPVYNKPGFIHSGMKETLKIKDGIIVESLPSITAYCTKYGYKNSGISKAIKLKTNAYGFQWKFK